MSEKIKEYWDQRAVQLATQPSATTDDFHLRELEIDTLSQCISDISLPKNSCVLDVGCGNGYSTLQLAERFPNFQWLGIDYSEKMIESATHLLNSYPLLKSSVQFKLGNLLDLVQILSDISFDLIISDRCLINLPSVEQQALAISTIARQVKPGGYFIAIENFIEGHQKMNEARNLMALPEIPIRWHNLYFSENSFLELVRSFFETMQIKSFASSYYFATRVLYSAMCQRKNVQPDYNHIIHQLACKLPWMGDFSPIRMVVMHKGSLKQNQRKKDFISDFNEEKNKNIHSLGSNQELRKKSLKWLLDVSKYKYSYLFEWLGRPIIQFPADILAMQEIIWRVKPDLIIETGIAHGGSLIFYASMLELIGRKGQVLGIDIDIRDHNRVEIEKHPMFKRITMIEGSSIDPQILRGVSQLAKGKKNVLVALDSNHTHEHVLKELNLYSPLVTQGSYLVVFDTVIEYAPKELFPDRSWEKGNNPMTAVKAFLKTTDRFIVDEEIENKLLVTVAPHGYLKCVKD